MTPKTRRKHSQKAARAVTTAQVAEAIGYVMRKRLSRMTDTQLGRFILHLTTGRN